VEVINLLSSFVLPDKTDFSFGASYGLLSLQEFHDFDFKKITRGKKLNSFNPGVCTTKLCSAVIRINQLPVTATWWQHGSEVCFLTFIE
jgi:hypothetical protein